MYGNVSVIFARGVVGLRRDQRRVGRAKRPGAGYFVSLNISPSTTSYFRAGPFFSIFRPRLMARRRLAPIFWNRGQGHDWINGYRMGRRDRTASAGPGLNRQLRQTLNHLLKGRTEQQISERLDMSFHTVHSRVKAIYRLFGVKSRSQLLARFLSAATSRASTNARSEPQRPVRRRSTKSK